MVTVGLVLVLSHFVLEMSSPIRGHVQRCPLQLSVSGALSLAGSPDSGAPGVRRAAGEG